MTYFLWSDIVYDYTTMVWETRERNIIVVVEEHGHLCNSW